MLRDAYFIPDVFGIPIILMPNYSSNLEYCWYLAHEIGHLTMHSGNRGRLLYAKDEAQANRWAACALIPEERIRAYQNACEDAFIGALSANYEDIPLEDCPLRELAAHIATIRLRTLEEVA